MSYMLDLHSEYAIGIDVGGTKIHAGIISKHGDIVQMCSFPTLAGEAQTAGRIYAAIESLLEQAAQTYGVLHLKGIGIGTAGQVEWPSGTIRFASRLLPDYTGTPLGVLVRERFGLPVFVDNDVNALALTEKILGHGRSAKCLLCLTLGTGVGGAVLIDGKLFHGAWGGAGEFGHLSVDYNGLPCICGGVGCLEQYVSGTGIAKRMSDKLAALGREISAPIDAKNVLNSWLSGDSAATEIMDEAIAAIGAALSSLAHIFNPEIIVIGGGVADAGEPFFTRIRHEARLRGMNSFFNMLRIEPAYQGNKSGMIGAGLQLWEYEDQLSNDLGSC